MLTLGVDVGGTKTLVATVDDTGRILHSERFPTASAHSLVDSIAAWLDRFPGVDGIGIGIPGPMPVDGRLWGLSNLPAWNGFRLAEAVMERSAGRRISIGHDVSCALLAEVHHGVLSGHLGPALCLSLGTGVGGALWDGTRLWSSDAAIEPGHVQVDPGMCGLPCECGNRGCLESLVGGRAIDAKAKRLGFGDGSGLLDAAGRGDAKALVEFRSYGRLLGIALRSIAYATQPQTVVMTGGWWHRATHLMRPTLEAEIGGLAWRKLPLRILEAANGPAAGVIGAACMASSANGP